MGRNSGNGSGGRGGLGGRFTRSERYQIRTGIQLIKTGKMDRGMVQRALNSAQNDLKGRLSDRESAVHSARIDNRYNRSRKSPGAVNNDLRRKIRATRVVLRATR